MRRTGSVRSLLAALVAATLLPFVALGASNSLQRGDLSDFREEALRAGALQPRWTAVVLFAPDGTRLVSPARRPRSSP